MPATRTDVHRPSRMDPADYTEVGYTDRHSEEGGTWIDPDYRDRDWAEAPFAERGGCDHCGQRIRFCVHYYHAPSDSIVTVGEQCATRMSLDSRERLEHQRLAEAEGRKARVAKLRETGCVDWLLTWHESDPKDRFPKHDQFYSSLASQAVNHGTLSERQLAALAKSVERTQEWQRQNEAERASEPDPSPVPSTDERVEVVGKIISSKTKETPYGTRFVMTVLDDRGFKVWGTQPESLEVKCPQDEGGWIQHEDGEFYRPADRGDRVRFTAALERSDRDESFGFFKRPTKAEVV